MKSIIGLLLIIAIAQLLNPVQSGEPWSQDEVLMTNTKINKQINAGELARRMWIYSNIAYCAEKSVDSMNCVACDQINPVSTDLAKSWSINGHSLFVYMDTVLNRVIVFFRGTEGLTATSNWKTNFNKTGFIQECIPLNPSRRFNKINKKAKIKVGLWPFTSTTLAQDLRSVGGALAQGANMVAGAVASGAGAAVSGAADVTIAGLVDIGSLTNQAFKGVQYVTVGPTADTYVRPEKSKQCAFHGGFLNMAYLLMQKKIVIDNKAMNVYQYVEKLYKDNTAQGVSFTGHSLGGAMATVGASFFLRQYIDKKNQGQTPDILVSSLYTFGSPQVGDKYFVEWFDTAARTLNVLNYRFRHRDDVVTVAFNIFFKHVGNVIRYADPVKGFTLCKNAANGGSGEGDLQCQIGYAASMSDHSAYFQTDTLLDIADPANRNTKKKQKCETRSSTEKTEDAAYQAEKERVFTVAGFTQDLRRRHMRHFQRKYLKRNHKRRQHSLNSK